jgi:hypothetical protein
MLASHEDELEPGEAEDRRDSRPASEPPRIGRSGAEAAAQWRPRGQPARRPRGGQPGVEERKDVAEEDAEDRHPDPEENEHRGRGEVGARALAAHQAAGHDRAEEGHADRATGHPDPGRDAAQPALVKALEARRGPHRRQADERGHQDDAGRPGEQPGRDRQERAADQAMRRRHARPGRRCGQGRKRPRARADGELGDRDSGPAGDARTGRPCGQADA